MNKLLAPALALVLVGCNQSVELKIEECTAFVTSQAMEETQGPGKSLALRPVGEVQEAVTTNGSLTYADGDVLIKGNVFYPDVEECINCYIEQEEVTVIYFNTGQVLREAGTENYNSCLNNLNRTVKVSTVFGAIMEVHYNL